MPFSWALGRKKSTSTLPGLFSDSSSLYSTFPRPTQQGTLALPTKLDEVAESVHECIPQQLPGEEATQDTVRYFLYQILTLKEYKIARNCPQWVLETCMCWQGDGQKLRSMPPDSFQQLCPLGPGYAMIDWTVKGSKFKPQDIPPCDVRQAIGHRIRGVVAGLMRKENGHRGPGWQDSNEPKKPLAGQSGEMDRTPTSASPVDPRFTIPSFATPPAYPVQNQFYGFGNHSMPLLHQISPVDVQQNPFNMHSRPFFAGSQYGPTGEDTVRRVFSSEGTVKHVPDDRPSDKNPTPVSSPASPASSHSQTESALSRLSESTAKTSPQSSESENNFWAPKTSRAHSIAQSVANSRNPGMYQASPQRTSTATPARYRSSLPSPIPQLDSRSHDLTRRMARLRSGSYSYIPAIYTPSEASLTPSDSVTNRYGLRRDPTMSPEMVHSSLRSQSPVYSSTGLTPSRLSTPQTYMTAPLYACDATTSALDRSVPSCLGSAMPISRCQTNFARPINNYRVDAHAFDSAEHVGLKSKPSAMRSLMIETERSHVLTRGKSETGLNCLNNFFSNVRGGEDSVGPSIRFQNPRTGQPRLTIYETIEEKEKLGKQHIEDQRRVEMWQGRGLTVYETIEEQEILNGKPQRGADTSVENNWSRYF